MSDLCSKVGDGLMVIEGSDAQVLELIRGWNRISSWKIEKVALCRPDTTTTTTESLQLDGIALEVERDSKIAYLDLLISFGTRWRCSGVPDIQLYQKPLPTVLRAC